MRHFDHGVTMPALIPRVALRVHKKAHAVDVVVPVVRSHQLVYGIHQLRKFAIVVERLQI